MEPVSNNPIHKHPNKIPDKNIQGHEKKPDQVYKKMDLVQESSNKEINATPDARNTKAERAAKILQQFKEDEPDLDAEQTKELSNALDRFISPLDKNSVFADTDLVLVDDSFTGNMPLNGIKKSELEQIEQLYKNICDEKEKITISPDDAAFKTLTEDAIKLLLTRNIGRKLIQKILNKESITNLHILFGEVPELKKHDDKIKIFLTTTSFNKLAYHPTGKMMVQEMPFFILLAHEMVHASHIAPDESDLATFSSKYTNMEEQQTITGLKKDLSLEDVDYDLKENFDELNEWNITAAFTNSQNVYYPRFSHQASLKGFFPLNEENIERIKIIAQTGILEEKNNLNLEIANLVTQGALYDLEELYKLNIIDIPKFIEFDQDLIPLMNFAVLSDDVKIVQFLLSKGFILDQTAADFYFDGMYSPEYSFDTYLMEHSEMMRFFAENKISIHGAFRKLHRKRIDHSNEEDYIALLKLIFKDHIKFSNFEFPFFSRWEKPSSDEIKFMNIFMDCASEAIQEFLTEAHTLDEYTDKETFLMYKLPQLQDGGFDTSQLNDSLAELSRKKKELYPS